ncbi:MAG: TolC family protein [Nitrospirota bacterium]
MKRYAYFIIFFIAFALLKVSITISWALEDEVKETERVKLALIIKEVLEKNPELASLRSRVYAFEERIDQASAWDDPKIGLMFMNIPIDSFSFRDTDMTQKTLSFTQKVPFPGKTELRRIIAEEAAGIDLESYREMRLRIVKDVKKDYYNLAFIYKAIDITSKNKAILEKFVKIAEAKYVVGKGLQQDVIKAQVEMSRMIEKLIALRQKKASLIADLNMLMDRSPAAPMGKIEELEKKEIDYTFEGLKTISFKRSPVLKERGREIERYKYSLELAKKEYYPDFGLGITYGQRDNSPVKGRTDFISGGISVNVPIWHKKKQGKKVSETVYLLNMAEDKYLSEKNKILFMIKDLMEKEEKTSQLIDLFKTGIIPQATQSLESAFAGYRVNKVDFLTLLHNQITLFKYEIEYYRMIADHEIVLAELEAVVGGDIAVARIQESE